MIGRFARRGVVAGLALFVALCGWSVAALSTVALATAGPHEFHASHEHYEVYLVAPLKAGEVGWCWVFNTSTGHGKGCPLILARGRPILDSGLSGLVLTTGEVAAVTVNGSAPIPTRAEPGLPYGLRTVLLELDPINAINEPPLMAPQLVPVNASGQSIPQPFTGEPKLDFLPSVFWQRPARPAQGACEIRARGVPGLTASWGKTVPSVRSFTGSIGQPFLTCASSTYYLRNSFFRAAVVLDATNPGARPASLPLMKPVPGVIGYFQAPGEFGRRTTVGRRIDGAWLLVESGSGL